jgi:hypothetical protein
VAGTTTLTLPAATDTLVGKATTDTLTNKTLTGAVMNGTLGATTPSTVAATTLTTSSTVTHNGGTANGVGYLDGSKVLTTGSALTFSGTALAVTGTLTSTGASSFATSSGDVGIGTSSPASKLEVIPVADSFFTGGLRVSRYSGGNLQYGTMTNNGGLALTVVETAVGTPVISFNRSSNGTTTTESARFDSSGNLLVGVASSTLRFVVGNAVAEPMVYVGAANLTATGGENAANAMMKFRKDNTTSRSINAAGTINASGADYAEYMTKAGDFTIAKGDVVGLDAQGKLTNVFADAVSFMVKSTDPSYVGGDSWGSEESIGLSMPEKPSQRQATEDVEAETHEEFAVRLAQYEVDQSAFDSALEVARQLVDRIAFAGQVPVNVTGATAGQYIIPVNDNGAIKGDAVSNPTFEQYQTAVGKVIAIESDGRAKIIVKVA